jgi:pSer/pThr/pTyr-binding forkhead associated (FHA) protein
LVQEVKAPDGTEHPFTNVPNVSAKPVLIGQEVKPAARADQITFVIPNSGRRITLSLDEQIRVGRADPTVSLYPEIDLTADGGAEFGVSRLHAAISRSEEGVVIVDMSSTNGTLLNNYALPSELPYPLSSGDELRFGDLLVHIFLD